MVLLALFAAAAPDAHAVIYGGNPEITIHVDRAEHDLTDGAVKLGTVRMFLCAGGGRDFAVGQWIDPVAGYTVPISAGDYCGYALLWDTLMDLDGYGSAGAYHLRYGQSASGGPLGTPIAPVALTPFTVVSGVIYGGNPELRVVIE